MKKVILKKQKYSVPIYGGIIHFVLATNLKYVYDEYKFKQKYEATDESTSECQVIDHRTPSGRQRIYVIFLKQNVNFKTRKIINTLGHELRHIVNLIARYRGLTLDYCKDEHMGYLQGDILEQMYKFIEEYLV